MPRDIYHHAVDHLRSRQLSEFQQNRIRSLVLTLCERGNVHEFKKNGKQEYL